MTGLMGTSRRILASDFEEAWFKDRVLEMNLEVTPHRKKWEFAIIAQIFRTHVHKTFPELLGFGVGREPLAAWFANQGGWVLATDLPVDQVDEAWRNEKTMQHAANRDELPNKDICGPARFRQNVKFNGVDMRDIPERLKRGLFDMTWSCGSLEHIGGLKAGMDFFLDQMACLRPGGLAVHTTEYNFGTTNGTIDEADLCLYRRKDFEALAWLLEEQGDTLWPLQLAQGESDADQIVLVHPYKGLPHISIAINEHVTTSVLLVAQRGGAG